MNFQNERPIYLQIVEQMEMEIMAGNYPKGSKLPTVRELAMQYKVNPNTMQKAFVELEQRGLVFTKRTSGRYVSEDESVVENLKRQAAKAKTLEYIRYVRHLGLEEEEVIRLFKECGKGESDELS